MYSLIRAIRFLQTVTEHGTDLPSRVPFLPRQNADAEPLSSSTKIGFIAIGICGLLSFIATLGLLLFLTHRFIFWKKYYKRPLAHNQYVVLIYNLLLADLQQATAFLLCLHWASQNEVSYPSAACALQGWWIQTADPGSGLFVAAIAIYTGAFVLRGRQLPYSAFVCSVIGLWVFILLLGIIPVSLYKSKTFVISEAGWCWLGSEHKAERLWGHYFWIFLAEFGTIILYGIMFFYLRRRMVQAAKLHRNQQKNLTRLNRVVIYMVMYPFAYIFLSLPLAAGRMSSSRHVVPSRAYFAVAGSLMASSGLLDAIVHVLTRRRLLLVTDLSASDGAYNAFSRSHAYQTHISTVSGGGKRKRIRGRSRGLQTLNDTANDDDRNESSEEIVQPHDWEMKNIQRGVYQETAIEITHEAASPEEGFHNHKPGAYSG